MKFAGDTPQTDVLLGMSLYGASRYVFATPYLERASAAQPGNAELRDALARNYLYAANYQGATAKFCEMLVDSPDGPGIHMLLGEAMMLLHQVSLRSLNFALRRRTDTCQRALRTRLFAVEDHEYDEADLESQRELASDPQNSQALAYWGDVALPKISEHLPKSN